MRDHPSSDVAFSPAVKAVQTLRRSRDQYARLRGELARLSETRSGATGRN